MSKNRKAGISAVLALAMLCVWMLSALAYAEEPMMVVEAPTAGEYSYDADGGLEIYDEVSYPGTDETDEDLPKEYQEVPTAAPTAVPLPTEAPQETASTYTVSFMLPSVWTNAA